MTDPTPQALTGLVDYLNYPHRAHREYGYDAVNLMEMAARHIAHLEAQLPKEYERGVKKQREKDAASIEALVPDFESEVARHQRGARYSELSERQQEQVDSWRAGCDEMRSLAVNAIREPTP